MPGIPVTLFGSGHLAALVAVTLAEAGHTVHALHPEAPEESRAVHHGSVYPPPWDAGLAALWAEQTAAGRILSWAQDEVPTIALWVQPPQPSPAEAERVWRRRFHPVAQALRQVRVLVLVEFGPAPDLGAAARALRSTLWNQPEPSLALLPWSIPARNALEALRRPTLWTPSSLGPLTGLEECQPLWEPFGSPVMVLDPSTALLLQATRHTLSWLRQVTVNTFPMGAVDKARSLRDYRRALEAGGFRFSDLSMPGLGLGGLLEARPSVLAELSLGVARGNELLKSARRAYAAFIDRTFAFLVEHLQTAPNPRLGVWGVTAEPETDQLIDSPTLELVRKLLEIGINVRVHDPSLQADPLRLPWVEVVSSPEEAADQADAVLLGSDWPQYKRLDLAVLRRHVRHPLFLDGRGLFDPAEMRSLGWNYHDTVTLL